MKTTYSKEDDIVYIQFLTVEEAGGFSELTQGEWPINVNITKKGKLMGIEILNASSIMNQSFLESAEQIKD